MDKGFHDEKISRIEFLMKEHENSLLLNKDTQKKNQNNKHRKSIGAKIKNLKKLNYVRNIVGEEEKLPEIPKLASKQERKRIRARPSQKNLFKYLE